MLPMLTPTLTAELSPNLNRESRCPLAPPFPGVNYAIILLQKNPNMPSYQL